MKRSINSICFCLSFLVLFASCSSTTMIKDEDVNVEAVIGGFFTVIPFLWTMKYNPVHNYVLGSINLNNNTLQESQQAQLKTKSKVERLRELKQLLDEKIINQQDFDKEKIKILEEKE